MVIVWGSLDTMKLSSTVHLSCVSLCNIGTLLHEMKLATSHYIQPRDTDLCSSKWLTVADTSVLVNHTRPGKTTRNISPVTPRQIGFRRNMWKANVQIISARGTARI